MAYCVVRSAAEWTGFVGRKAKRRVQSPPIGALSVAAGEAKRPKKIKGSQ